MRLELVRRPEPSMAMTLLSPLIAIALTVVTGFIIFTIYGVDPFQALYVFFIEPLTAQWSLEDLVVKATPIILIAIGLSFCYLSNTWNIGAEGQLIAGAIFGSIPPIFFPGWQDPSVLVVMLLMGVLGGMLYAAIPALLKTRFGANEILTSLMLVYVAQLLVDYLARGPWRNPEGHNFPDSRPFEGWQLLPTFGNTNVRISIIFVLIAVVVVGFLMRNTLTGFQVRVIGQAPRAGAFAGFSRNRMVLIAFLISGGLAGLAGICEVAGPIGMLRISVSPGYGFTAIIVAFLGRLNPYGILIAGFVLALTFLGGEGAQISLGLPEQMTRVFQGLVLFYVLACDTFIVYRPRIHRAPAAAAAEASHGHG
jgi:general nucleoside transport system permease protein